MAAWAAANKAVDEEYRTKHQRFGARYVDPMVAADARTTRIKLLPADVGVGE